jgi:hypothetical protein
MPRKECPVEVVCVSLMYVARHNMSKIELLEVSRKIIPRIGGNIDEIAQCSTKYPSCPFSTGKYDSFIRKVGTAASKSRTPLI